MRRISPAELVHQIALLPQDRSYTYVDLANPGLIQIVAIQGDEGPVRIKRYDSRTETPASVDSESISSGFFRRLAAAIQENEPFSIDAVFQGSYNCRAAVEGLLAHTPQFYSCRPGRIEATVDGPVFHEGVKHLIWVPDEPHKLGEVRTKEVTRIVTDLRSAEYGQIDFSTIPADRPETQDEARTHSLIQIALAEIGIALGCHSYVGADDQEIVYRGAVLTMLPGIVSRLEEQAALQDSLGAIKATEQIDCIWLKECRIPAMFEIKHRNGVYSSLSRMQIVNEALVHTGTRNVIVAPDASRGEVARIVLSSHIGPLRPFFLPYSTVLSLYAIVHRWERLRDATGSAFELLDAFLEPCAT